MIDKFYNEIITGAVRGVIKTSVGNIDAGFNTIIPEKNIRLINEKNKLVYPTLIINDVNKFNEVLQEYITLAHTFYINFNLDYNSILAMLFVDASYEDFLNPISYINRKIDFLNDKTLSKYTDKSSVGYSSILNGEIFVQVEKMIVFNETPYRFRITLENGDSVYEFPFINFGISNEKAYIYNIQRDSSNKEKTDYEKKVNRSLFKIGEGFDVNDDNYEKYREGNLKDVSASFVVASNIFMSILESVGIYDIVLPSIRLVRWNNKEEYNRKKYSNDKEKYEENSMLNIMNQKNITEKFLRTFMRLCYHYDNLDVVSYPFEADSCMHIHNGGSLVSNNSLLNETYGIINNSKEVKVCL